MRPLKSSPEFTPPTDSPEQTETGVLFEANPEWGVLCEKFTVWVTGTPIPVLVYAAEPTEREDGTWWVLYTSVDAEDGTVIKAEYSPASNPKNSPLG